MKELMTYMDVSMIKVVDAAVAPIRKEVKDQRVLYQNIKSTVDYLSEEIEGDIISIKAQTQKLDAKVGRELKNFNEKLAKTMDQDRFVKPNEGLKRDITRLEEEIRSCSDHVSSEIRHMEDRSQNSKSIMKDVQRVLEKKVKVNKINYDDQKDHPNQLKQRNKLRNNNGSVMGDGKILNQSQRGYYSKPTGKNGRIYKDRRYDTTYDEFPRKEDIIQRKYGFGGYST